MIYGPNITNVPHITDLLDIARKLSLNMGFGGDVESVPSCVECFTGNETHEDVGIVKAPVIASITINWTVRIICENFRYRNPCTLRNMNHGFGLGNVDMSTKLDDDFR
jgi:hypothetical protein